MLLVIDVGNTQTAIGVYEGESLDRMWRVATNRDHTADELRVKLLPLLQSENLQASDITGAALASVVPQLTGAWTRAVQDLAGVRAVVCSAKIKGIPTMRDMDIFKDIDQWYILQQGDENKANAPE